MNTQKKQNTDKNMFSPFAFAEFEISTIERALDRLEKIKKFYRDNKQTWQNKKYYKAVDVHTKLALEHGETLREFWKQGIFI